MRKQAPLGLGLFLNRGSLKRESVGWKVEKKSPKLLRKPSREIEGGNMEILTALRSETC